MAQILYLIAYSYSTHEAGSRYPFILDMATFEISLCGAQSKRNKDNQADFMQPRPTLPTYIFHFTKNPSSVIKYQGI